MNNEELAMQAKLGDRQAISALWEQTGGLIQMLTGRLLSNPASAERAAAAGVTMDDLTQEGYFALLDAVQAYDPAAEYKFTTYINRHIKNGFFACVGLRTQQQRKDLLTAATRLDAPLCNDEGEEIDRYALIPDPNSGAEVERFERADYTHSLHKALEACLARLPEETAEIIRARYYAGQTLGEVGLRLGKSPERIRQQETKGLRNLRHPACRRMLAPYHDEIVARRCYSGTGFGAWKNSGSVEERAVEKLEKAELNKVLASMADKLGMSLRDFKEAYPEVCK